MLRPLYDRLLRLSGTPWATPTLAAMSFAEASFFPLIPDVLLAPMVLARPERAWRYAAICTLASVLGGLFGYAIGVFLQPVAVWILTLFGHNMSLATYRSWFAHNGFVVILLKGLTPIPYKLVTIASGLARFDLRLFVLASVITRGGRFFFEAAVLRHPAAKAFIDRHLVILSFAGALLVIGVLALTFLH